MFVIVMFFGTYGGKVSAEPNRVYLPEELTEIRQAGTYSVQITAEESGEMVDRVVQITIKYPYTVVDNKNGEGIDASDFEYQIGEPPEKLGDEQLIERANAHAWSLQDGSGIAITKTVVEKVSDYQYNISFYTGKGTGTTVQAVRIGAGILDNKEFMKVYGDGSIDRNFNWEDRYWMSFFIALFILVIAPTLMTCVLYFELRQETRELESLLYKKGKADS